MEELTDEDWMPFGKYGPGKGDPRKMKNVPSGYLIALWDKEDGLWCKPSNPVHAYIKSSWSALYADVKHIVDIEHFPK